jgi:hypothetical protein
LGGRHGAEEGVVDYSKETRDDNRWARGSLKGGDKGGERVVNFGSAAPMQVPLPSFLERKERDAVAQGQSSSRVEREHCGGRRATSRTQRIPYVMCQTVHSWVFTQTGCSEGDNNRYEPS